MFLGTVIIATKNYCLLSKYDADIFKKQLTIYCKYEININDLIIINFILPKLKRFKKILWFILRLEKNNNLCLFMNVFYHWHILHKLN